MKTDTLAKVVRLVESASDDEVAIIIRALNRRSKTKAQLRHLEAMKSIHIGDKVRLRGLKPKYLNGHTGVVISRINDKFKVELDPGVDPRAVRRFGYTPICPAGCLEKIEDEETADGPFD